MNKITSSRNYKTHYFLGVKSQMKVVRMNLEEATRVPVNAIFISSVKP
jgi:hypothetical protein